MSDSDNSTVVEVDFLTVPPPRSGHVVDLLRTVPTVSRAAAVYSGVDVVAVLEGSVTEIDLAHADIESRGAPIANIESFRADIVIPGRSAGSRLALLRGACGAFVRCDTRVEEYTVDYSASILTQLQGVTRLYVNRHKSEVVIEVVSANKGAFDDTVMSTIQGQWSVVRSTRTLLTINSMSWQRDMMRVPQDLVFVSLANRDLPFGAALCRRLHHDLGLTCWTYSDIPVASGSWPAAVDGVMSSAQLHIFLLSIDSLASSECQREFGKVEATAPSADICCILLPGCDIAQLPVRYQMRQCLKADDVFAYPRMVEWIERRLAGEV